MSDRPNIYASDAARSVSGRKGERTNKMPRYERCPLGDDCPAEKRAAALMGNVLEAAKALRNIEQDETAWLIEAAESEVSRPLYWAGSFGDERDHWTYDHMKAVRLSRKEDAEAVSAGVLSGYTVRICEHGWTQ